MKYLILILFLSSIAFADCDSICVWIIERHNCTKFWHFGKWTWRVKEGGSISIGKDTVCKVWKTPEYEKVQGKWLFWCDSVDIVKARFYPDSIYSVLREK